MLRSAERTAAMPVPQRLGSTMEMDRSKSWPVNNSPPGADAVGELVGARGEGTVLLHQRVDVGGEHLQPLAVRGHVGIFGRRTGRRHRAEFVETGLHVGGARAQHFGARLHLTADRIEAGAQLIEIGRPQAVHAQRGLDGIEHGAVGFQLLAGGGERGVGRRGGPDALAGDERQHQGQQNRDPHQSALHQDCLRG